MPIKRNYDLNQAVKLDNSEVNQNLRQSNHGVILVIMIKLPNGSKITKTLNMLKLKHRIVIAITFPFK